jgi:hypothetical protein
MSYERLDMNSYVTPLGANPGVSLNRIRDTTQTGAERARQRRPRPAGPAAADGPPGSRRVPATQSYPMTPLRTDNVDIFNPNMQTPYAQSWTGGIRRKVTKDIGIEARYVGTRHLQGWVSTTSMKPTSPRTGS